MLKSKSTTATRNDPADRVSDCLLAYSRGLLSRQDALRELGLRDYAQLLVALGDAGLTMPLPPEAEVRKHAETFVDLWKMG